jgi:hypothetical protein
MFDQNAELGVPPLFGGSPYLTGTVPNWLMKNEKKNEEMKIY